MDAALQEYNTALLDFQKSLKGNKTNTFVDPLKEATSAAEAIALASDLESSLDHELEGRRFAKAHPALKKRVEEFQRYAPAIDVFVSSNPAIAALVWGSVKLALQSIVDFLDPFERVFEVFRDVASTLPRTDIYQKHAKAYPSIQAALHKLHINLVRFFAASLTFLKRHGFRALVASLLGKSDPDFENTSHILKEDAHQLDLLVSAIAFDAAAEEAARNTRRSFFQWLNADPENDRRFDFARAQIHPDTCSWIATTPEFQQWAAGLEPGVLATNEDDTCPVLEIQGEEGCGKTVLAAWLTENLSERAKREQMAFVYYFQESGGFIKENRAVLAAFIVQILRNNQSLLDANVTKHLQESCNTIASEGECYDVLRPLVQRFDSVVMLLDSRYAFYNTRHYQLMIRLKGQEDQQRLHPTRVSRTNGSLPGIVVKGLLLFETDNWPSRFRPQSVQVLNLSHLNQTRDEERFISSQAQAICNLHYDKELPEWSMLNERINKQLCREPRAHFLLLRLMAEYLRVQTSPQAVEEALHSLSPSVRSIYEKAFLRIQQFEDSRTQLGFNVLQWVAFALRSLHVSELADALIVRTNEKSLNPARRHSKLEYQIREICGPFVSLTDGFVHPAHASMKMFLQDVIVVESTSEKSTLALKYVSNHNQSTRGYNPTGFEAVGRNRIARACVAYLSLDAFSQLSTTERKDWTGRFPFLDYALHCWLHHVLILASYLKNPERGYRMELGFDREVLELVGNFLTLSQSWTYLQNLVVGSSVREALETLRSHMWPVRELVPIMQGPTNRSQKGQESVKAGYLESWMRKAIERLETVQDLPVEEALPKLRDGEKLYDHRGILE